MTRAVAVNDRSAEERAALALLLLFALAAAGLISVETGRTLSEFREESPVLLRAQLDPNSATERELQCLPGIGPRLAAAIVAYRASCGQTPAYQSIDDLDRVPRIGPRLIARLRPWLALPAEGAKIPEPPAADAASFGFSHRNQPTRASRPEGARQP